MQMCEAVAEADDSGRLRIAHIELSGMIIGDNHVYSAFHIMITVSSYLGYIMNRKAVR